MIREKITDPWRRLLGGGDRLRREAPQGTQEKYGKDLGRRHHLVALHERGELSRPEARPRGLRQQQHRHLRARCHSPTGYGLAQAFGTSAGTQDFDSVDDADVILVIGANPTDAHPVFGSRMKKRLREGAKLIVIDPRRIDSCARRTSSRLITCRSSPAPTSPS